MRNPYTEPFTEAELKEVMDVVGGVEGWNTFDNLEALETWCENNGFDYDATFLYMDCNYSVEWPAVV